MEEKKIKTVEEQYIQVSESRIKNTIKEYKKGQPFNWVISSSFSCAVSFFIAFASYQSNDSVWKWIFLALGALSALILSIFGIISLARKKLGTGTEKWFLEEIKDEHHEKPESKVPSFESLDSDAIFKIVKGILLVGIPVGVLLLVLGLNGWDISNEPWCGMFWFFWSILSILWLVWGTYPIAFLAYVIFGYEYDGDYPGNLF